jgi:hypothetical protein
MIGGSLLHLYIYQSIKLEGAASQLAGHNYLQSVAVLRVFLPNA